jgi:hypothetical protein
MSQAVHAKGTLMQVETSEGSGAYVTIPEVGAIEGPSPDKTEHDVTSHSTDGIHTETLLGLVNSGALSFPISEIPANALHKQLRNDAFTLTKRNYRVVETSGEFATYRCAVKTYARSRPTDGPRRAQVTLRVLELPAFSD